MATSPGLLLLDEPLSALDARVRVHLRTEIKDLQRRLGVTTVMVTHDQEEALTMADRIVVMNQGVIEQIGTPEEIYRQPATMFVADFIGSMNFVPGRVGAAGLVNLGELAFCCETDGFDLGADVTIAIRPEDVNPQPDDAENVLEVETRQLEFLGSYYRAELVSDAFADRVLEADFSVNFVRRNGVHAGAKMAISLPADLIRVYPRA